MIAAVSESSLRRQGTLLVPGQIVDWHALNLRIVGGDLHGGLSTLPAEIQTVIGDAVHQSVAAGFGMALAVGAIIAVVSSVLSWLLIRAAKTHQAASTDKVLRSVYHPGGTWIKTRDSSVDRQDQRAVALKRCTPGVTR